MKVLLTHRYFWPDTAPYALILRSIGEGLVDAGHEVHVFASMPSYRDQGARAPKAEKLGRLKVRRCRVFRENRKRPVQRGMNVFLYCTALFFHVLRLRPDVVTASTFPPVIAGWVASLAARLVGAQFVYHMMDIHPEVSTYSGGGLGQGMPARILRWLDNHTLRRSGAIVVLSEDMAETLRARGIGPLPIYVINNFSVDLFDRATEPPTGLCKPLGTRRVIFAGNLGRFQNLPLLAEGVSRLFDKHPELELFFLGDGAALPELKDRWSGHPQVDFAPFLPFEQARKLIAEADIGLVSLTPGIYRVAYPSKVFTYLGLGVPILALVEPGSALARTLTEAGIGGVPNADTPEEIAATLEALLARDIRGETVRAWYTAHADRSRILAAWSSLIGEFAPLGHGGTIR